MISCFLLPDMQTLGSVSFPRDQGNDSHRMTVRAYGLCKAFPGTMHQSYDEYIGWVKVLSVSMSWHRPVAAGARRAAGRNARVGAAWTAAGGLYRPDLWPVEDLRWILHDEGF
jgi:hypothetical protein